MSDQDQSAGVDAAGRSRRVVEDLVSLVELTPDEARLQALQAAVADRWAAVEGLRERAVDAEPSIVFDPHWD